MRPRTPWAGGLFASLFLHASLVFLWRSSDAAPSEVGGVERAIIALQSPRIPSIQSAAPSPVARPRLPTPARIAREVVEADLARVANPPSRMPEIVARGTPETGTGERPVASEADLAGGRDRPPIPVSILPDWRPPPRALGSEMRLRVFITAEGRPTGLVEIVTPTPDGEFNQRVADRVRRLAYRPALRGGSASAGWAEISFVFCKATVTATSPPAPRPEPLCGPPLR